MSSPGSTTWQALLGKGLACLDSLATLGIPAPEWTFGGGTVLMLRYGHRVSRDVDLFLHEAQYLTALSPRLNAVTAAMTGDYDESSASLKLTFEEGEVDFIIAPSLLGLAPEPLDFQGRTVLLDATAEILAKKLFYRTASLKVRDVFDLGVALLHEPDLPERILPVLPGKAAQLKRRLTDLAPRFAERLATEVDRLPSDGRAAVPTPTEILACVGRFVGALPTAR